MALGECQEMIQIMKKLVHEEVARSPGAHAFTIALFGSKIWLAMTMLALVDEIATPFDSSSMKDFMGRFKNISSPNIYNYVHFFKIIMCKRPHGRLSSLLGCGMCSQNL